MITSSKFENEGHFPMPATSDDASVTLVELAPTSASAYDVLLTLDHTEVAMLAVAIVPMLTLLTSLCSRGAGQRKDLRPMGGLETLDDWPPVEKVKGPSGKEYRSTSIFCLLPAHQPRKAAIQFCEMPYFDPFILLTILANCGTMAWQSPLDPPGTWKEAVMGVCEDVFLAIFTAEMLTKILAYGFAMHKGSYLRDAWCQLDFLVVSLAWLPILFPSMGNYSVLRAFRALRPLRALKRVPGMPLLVQWILSVLPKMFNVLMLCGFVFLLFGIVGMELFKGSLHYRCAMPGFVETPGHPVGGLRRRLAGDNDGGADGVGGADAVGVGSADAVLGDGTGGSMLDVTAMNRSIVGGALREVVEALTPMALPVLSTLAWPAALLPSSSKSTGSSLPGNGSNGSSSSSSFRSLASGALPAHDGGVRRLARRLRGASHTGVAARGQDLSDTGISCSQAGSERGTFGMCPEGTSCMYFDSNPSHGINSFDDVALVFIVFMQVRMHAHENTSTCISQTCVSPPRHVSPSVSLRPPPPIAGRHL